jgi:hypothetical protein
MCVLGRCLLRGGRAAGAVSTTADTNVGASLPARCGAAWRACRSHVDTSRSPIRKSAQSSIIRHRKRCDQNSAYTLKGSESDTTNVILSAVGHYLRLVPRRRVPNNKGSVAPDAVRPAANMRSRAGAQIDFLTNDSYSTKWSLIGLNRMGSLSNIHRRIWPVLASVMIENP